MVKLSVRTPSRVTGLAPSSGSWLQVPVNKDPGRHSHGSANSRDLNWISSFQFGPDPLPAAVGMSRSELADGSSVCLYLCLCLSEEKKKEGRRDGRKQGWLAKLSFWMKGCGNKTNFWSKWSLRLYVLLVIFSSFLFCEMRKSQMWLPRSHSMLPLSIITLPHFLRQKNLTEKKMYLAHLLHVVHIRISKGKGGEEAWECASFSRTVLFLQTTVNVSSPTELSEL